MGPVEDRASVLAWLIVLLHVFTAPPPSRPPVSLGACGVCGHMFVFDPAGVMWRWEDPASGLPPGDAGGWDRAIPRPVCPMCVEGVDWYRVRAGLPPIRAVAQ